MNDNPESSELMLLKYFHTIRHLRYVQIMYMLRYRFRRYFRGLLAYRINSIPGKTDGVKLIPKTQFIIYPWFQTNDITEGKFTFLNQHAEYSEKIQWRDESKSRLWRYNLHYFQYLFPADGLPPEIGRKLINGWIDENPPFTRDAWEPYPASLRIVNWIKYVSNVEINGELYDKICRSLYQQTLFLEKSLEFDQLGNHIFKNIKALIFAGLFFNSNDSQRWKKKGLTLLKSEMKDEILPDGGHVERSPMYHSMILEDCLDLQNILMTDGSTDSKVVAEHLGSTAKRMLEFLIGIIHPDGQIPLLNDAAFGVESQPSDLLDYYKRLNIESITDSKTQIKSYPDSGYFCMKPTTDNFLIVDCGPIGPDYQPGHGHCDALSFELSIKGKRVIVDSGCFTYEEGEIRDYNRGNAGHNTVTIDGKNQSEIWGSFRIAQRAYPLQPKIWMNGDQMHFEGAHTGYKRLKGKPIHKRFITWNKDIIEVEDNISGDLTHDFRLTLNFHPSYKISLKDGKAHIHLDDNFKLLVSPLGNDELFLTNGWYCPEFGQKIKNNVLILKGTEQAPFKVGWNFQIF